MNVPTIQQGYDSPHGDGLAHASLEELLALRHQVPRLGAGLRARAAPSGQHLSRVHARGVDYAESRIYQPGDDIRVMDWRVTARTGKAHTKLFLEERERDLLLLVDMNLSMHFGTRRRFKSVQALRAAALAAWMTVVAGDRVGALTFGRSSAWLRPRGGVRGALLLLGDLQRLDHSKEGTEQPLSQALLQVLRRLHGGSRVLLISDGFSCDDEAASNLRRLSTKVDVAVLGIADVLETRVPAIPGLAVEHDGRKLRLALDRAAARRSFQHALGRGRRELDILCHDCGVRRRWIDTAAEPQAALRELLAGTLQRRRGR